MCTFAHPCPILVSAVLPLFLNGCRKVSGGSKQGLGTASWVFVLVLISRNFLLRIFNLFLKHPSKKGEKKDKRNLNPYPTIHPRWNFIVYDAV